MEMNKKKWRALLFIGLSCATVLAGCNGEKKSASEGDSAVEDMVAEPGMTQGMYKPSELTIPSQEIYEFPYMGLKFSVPKSLLERMDKKEAAMLSLGEATDDETRIRYFLLCWKSMTDEQRDMEVENGGNGFYDWADSLEAIGAIGVYDSESAGRLDELTGCTEHQEIGKSEDGAYTYYLSTNSAAEAKMQEEIAGISYEWIPMISLDEEEQAGSAANENVGEFSMTDIAGESYTQEMFAENDLTLVNIFTTWCSPCVKEIPDLEELNNEMADQGVAVVGIVLDIIDESGNADEEVVEKAKLLAERTGATYPFLIPDAGLLNGRLAGINAVPETFFVDKEGNIVGETYTGSRSSEEWKSIVEELLKGVKQ